MGLGITQKGVSVMLYEGLCSDRHFYLLRWEKKAL